MNTTLKAPALIPVGTAITLHDGSQAIVDSFGCVTVNSNFANELQTAGFDTVFSAQAALANATTYGTQTDTTNALIPAATLAAAADVTLNMTGALGSGQTLTMPTVAQLIAALPESANLGTGVQIKLRIINSGAGAFAWTLTTAATWTMNGTMTIAQNTWREFLITIQGPTTGTVQQRGTGTNS